MNKRQFLIHTAIAASVAATSLAGAAPQAALRLEPYNPGGEAIFPVSSVLVLGRKQAILVDAQFGRSQAEQLVARLKASGRTLAAIYISHGDPDYYFGLETVLAAFPGVKVLATSHTVAHIEATRAAKLAFWGPKLGSDAPAATVVPQVLAGDRLTLEGQTIEVRGLKGPQPERSYLWIPSLKAVIGGVVLSNNQHVWMADTQSPQSHADWLATLKDIAELKPRTIVPGHALPGASGPLQSVAFTAGYIRDFDEEAARAADSTALIAAMKRRYPDAGEVSSLELSAKVAKGEMRW
jgi:glyoxylase-like metal-dependent hydrolase (beta-lactamase superfamily II)